MKNKKNDNMSASEVADTLKEILKTAARERIMISITLSPMEECGKEHSPSDTNQQD